MRAQVTQDELRRMVEHCQRYNSRKRKAAAGKPDCRDCNNRRWTMEVIDNEIKVTPCHCQEQMKEFGNRRIWGGAR